MNDDEFLRFLHGEEGFGDEDDGPVDAAVLKDGADETSEEAEADELTDETSGEAETDELADETSGEAETDELADETSGEAEADELADETSGEAETDEFTDETSEETEASGNDASEEPEGGDKPEEKGEERAISSDLIRGHINTIILRSLYDGDKYGYEIIAEIERKSHGQYSLKQPSLYSALKRLEKDGFITSYWGGSVGGGRRKYFSLTDEGKAIAERNQTEWEYSRTVIDSLISDRTFDFAQPAPSAVDMRVLKKSTTRVTGREDEEEEFEYDEESTEDEGSLAAERAAFEAERARYEESLRVREEVLRAREEAGTRREQELLEREFALAAEEEQRKEAQSKEAEAESAQEAARSAAVQQTQQAQQAEEPVQEPREPATAELAVMAAEAEAEAEREKLLARIEEAEQARAQALLGKKEEQNARIAATESLAAERNRYEKMLRDQEAELEARYRRELAMQEAQIRAEAEADLRRREREMIHNNFLNLVNSTRPAEEAPASYYYEQPQPAQPYAMRPEAEREYRSVIRRLYENATPAQPPEPAYPPVPAAQPEPVSAPVPATQPEPVAKEPARRAEPVAKEPAEPAPRSLRALGGIDFYDLEARAAQDGIRITVSGGSKKEVKEKSESLVHRGKALFLSALVVFLLLLAEGSLALGFQSKLSLPRFYPFLIWGTGLALFLVTGVMFLNRYGENSLRRTGNLLINVIVAYALCVILILIVALAARIDFANAGELATFVIFPAVYFFSIVVFGLAYYLQVRPAGE